jgi:hypothetical protein
MLDELVDADDVLMAMADALMEKQPKPFKPILKFNDEKIEFNLGGRPPREIFYRNTVTYMTKLPPPVPNKMCSVRYACMGNAATIKCHSCSIYDPSGTAFYCSQCFECCHPWYRVSHVYTTIEKDESIEHTLKIAHRVAEANRYEREGTDILHKLQKEKPKLAYIADDAELDKQLRNCGRRVLALEEHVQGIRKKIRDDILISSKRKSLVGISNTRMYLSEDLLNEYMRNNGSSSPRDPPSSSSSPNKKEKILKIKSVSRQNTKKSLLLLTEEEKKEVGKGSIDPVTTETIDTKPESTVLEDNDANNHQNNNNNNENHENENNLILEIDAVLFRAATRIQTWIRGYLARKTVSSIMTLRIVRVWNPADGKDFYFDRVTEESSWIPSPVRETKLFVGSLV